MPRTPQITFAQAENMMFHGGAFCAVCQEVDEYANTETDAVRHYCHTCGQSAVYGGAEALDRGLVEVV